MTINVTMEYTTQDENGFRSYELNADGDCLAELLATATITAVDRDGDEVYTIGLEESEGELALEAFALIQQAIEDNICRDQDRSVSVAWQLGQE
jgi:hypothetical protein